MNKTNKLKSVLLCLIAAALSVMTIVVILNKTFVRDKIKSLLSNPTPEVLNIEQKLDLTESAKLIFSASNPTLDSSETFNSYCSSYDINTAILGCYSDEKIHIYNIDLPALSGIVESTAAHEFLHAVWERLSGIERDKLSIDLKKVYSENCEKLCETLKNYNEANQLNELYARVGTQISDLPESLENHYKKYFKDRQKIVEFYNSYISTFDEITKKNDELYSEIENLEKEISEMTLNYQNELQSYSDKVDEFNNCANTPGCFSQYTFNIRRNELINEQAYLLNFYDEINEKIENYNSKARDYNENILYGQKLNDAINSNTAPAEL